MAVTHIAVFDIALDIAVDTEVDIAVDAAVDVAVDIAVDIAVGVAVAVDFACPRIRCVHDSLKQFYYRINMTTAHNTLRNAPHCFFPKAPDAAPLSLSLA